MDRYKELQKVISLEWIDKMEDRAWWYMPTIPLRA
jgi:hypothetical protein